MSITPQFALNFWIRPACDALALVFDERRMTGPASWAMLLRTMAVESAFKYRKQIRGPALSYFQIEPNTARHLVIRTSQRMGQAGEAVSASWYYSRDDSEETEEDRKSRLGWRIYSDQFTAAQIARMKYWFVPEAMPLVADLEGQAQYWKQYYNTYLGAGTIPMFRESHGRHLRRFEEELGWFGGVA